MQWLPSIVLLLVGISSFFVAEPAKYLPTLFFGTYIGWIYLRYWQKKPETKIKGDPGDDFSFSSFFPELLRLVIDPIATIFGCFLCGKHETQPESDASGSPLPGSDPIEASRRRERGARALEERLAVERLAASLSSEESRKDAIENV